MRIYLIRHGRTTAGKIILDQKLDPPLLNNQSPPQYLVDQSFDKIYCSPLLRTVETAELLTEKRNIEIHQGLIEMDLGSISGKPYTLKTFLALAYLKITNTTRFHSEDQELFIQRCQTTFDQIVNTALENKFENIAIVTHNGVLLALLRNHLSLLPWYKFKVGYLEPIVLEYDSAEFRKI